MKFDRRCGDAFRKFIIVLGVAPGAIVHISCDRFSMYHTNLGENVVVVVFLPTHCKG